jgi:hypothetical protein
VKAKRLSIRSRLSLTLASGSVVLAHAVGAGWIRFERALIASLRRRLTATDRGTKELR